MAKLLKIVCLNKALLLYMLTYAIAQHPAYEYEKDTNKLFENGEFKETIRLGQEGLLLRPTSVTMLNVVGQSYFILKEYKKSKIQFDKILSIGKLKNDKSILALAYNNLGEWNRVKKNHKEALIYYNKAIKLNATKQKELTRNIYNKGKLYKAQKAYNKAINYYQKALNLKPDLLTKSLIYNELGLIAELRKDYEKAQEYYEEGIKLVSKEGDYYKGILHGNIGRLFLIRNMYDKALKHLNMGISHGRKANDKHGLIMRLHNLTAYYIKLKKYKEGVSTVNEIISLKKELGYLDLQKEYQILVSLNTTL